MDFDVVSVGGETQFQLYTQVQQVTTDTDPQMWWKQQHQEFPNLVRMARQYLNVAATSVSPERFFSRVGLVKTDLCGSLLPTHSLTYPYIFTFLCFSHTNTLEVLLNLPHHIPYPTFPTINLVDKRSLLIRSC